MIVVNTHLYGLDVASGGGVLPEHDVVVFDEAHVLEDVMSDTVGVEIAPGRFTTLAGVVRRIIEDPQLIGSIAEIAESLRDTISRSVGQRLTIALRTRCRTCSPMPGSSLGSRRARCWSAMWTDIRGREAAQVARPVAPGRAIEGATVGDRRPSRL